MKKLSFASPCGPLIAAKVNFCTADFTNPAHLRELMGQKCRMDEKEKNTFKEFTLKDQLSNVIHNHTPSELKMIYMRVCMTIGISPDPDYFKSTSKGKIGLEEIIWVHRLVLKVIWNE